MAYILLGHLFQLMGIFLAFLAAGLAIMLMETLQGGRIGTASKWEAIGMVIIALDIFMVYMGAITGRLDLLNVTLFWPILGAMTLTGFTLICYGKWQMIKSV